MPPPAAAFPALWALTLLLASSPTAMAVGVNWGWDSSHPLPPDKVVAILQANNVSRVRLPDVDARAMEALSGTRIGVMVGIPDESLRGLNASRKAAEDWVHDNVTRYVVNSGGGGIVRIEYISVGDQPFLKSYGDQFRPFVLGAATNIQMALTKATLAEKIKVVVPCSLDVLQSVSSLPSKALFRSDVNKTMTQILSFLVKHSSPFVVNINLFSILNQNKNFTLEKALFRPTLHPLKDGHKIYNNTFDASLDSLISSLSKAGFGTLDIIVGQIGWPTDGAVNASSSNAETFMKGLLSHLDSKDGTPLRPRRPPVETYIFSLLDEDQRSIATGNYERHWGVFTFDGQAKYKVDLGQDSHGLVNAHSMEYLASKWCVVDNSKDISNASSDIWEACKVADCTPLFP